MIEKYQYIAIYKFYFNIFSLITIFLVDRMLCAKSLLWNSLIQILIKHKFICFVQINLCIRFLLHFLLSICSKLVNKVIVCYFLLISW